MLMKTLPELAKKIRSPWAYKVLRAVYHRYTKAIQERIRRRENRYNQAIIAQYSGRLPIYYVIRRAGGTAGLFSFFQTTISKLMEIDQHGFIPVVDLQTDANIYLHAGEVGRVNAWDFFFQQPGGTNLATALALPNRVVDTSVGKIMTIVDLSLVKDGGYLPVDARMKEWRRLARKHIRLSTEAQEFATQQQALCFGDRKIKTLGILCRGTEYVRFKPYGHPIQPTAEETIEKAKSVMRDHHCDRVFLATEDMDILKKCEDAFGDRLLYVEQTRYRDLNYAVRGSPDAASEDRKLKGMQYLSAIVLLSQCDCLIGGHTCGTLGALLLSDGFEYAYVWDKGNW